MLMSLFLISPVPRANRRTLIHAVYKYNVFDTSLAANRFSGESPEELPAPLRPLRCSSSTHSQEKGGRKVAKSGYFLKSQPSGARARRAEGRNSNAEHPPAAKLGCSSCWPKAGPFAGRIWGWWGRRGSAAGKGVRPARPAGEADVRVSHPIESRVLQTHGRSTLLPRVGPVGTIRDVGVQRVHEHLRDRNLRN